MTDRMEFLSSDSQAVNVNYTAGSGKQRFAA